MQLTIPMAEVNQMPMPKGFKHTQASKDKMSASHMGHSSSTKGKKVPAISRGRLLNPIPLTSFPRLGDASKKSKFRLLTSIYSGINRRCNNPNDRDYPKYGGRGIKVCDEWRNDYFTFKKWALGAGWKRGLQINRIDNDGNYEPGNCEFLTNTQHQKIHYPMRAKDFYHRLR